MTPAEKGPTEASSESYYLSSAPFIQCNSKHRYVADSIVIVQRQKKLSASDSGFEIRNNFFLALACHLSSPLKRD